MEGHYYACICLGEYGKGIGIASAIFKGLGGKYEKLGNRAIAIDASYERGGPLRAMGRYYQKLPSLVRKLDKAEQFFRKSERAAPCMTRTRFYLVELYMEQEQWGQARASAEAGLNTPGCPEHALECAHYQERIRQLRSQMPAQ